MKAKTKALIAVLLFIISLQPVLAWEYIGPEAELISLINTERKAAGAPPLTIDWEVARLARYKSEEMKKHQLFSHESLIYGSPAQLLDRFDVAYTALGANIAMGQETARDVIDDWRKSSGHTDNLLNSDYTRAGVGLSWDDNGISYWTLILIAN